MSRNSYRRACDKGLYPQEPCECESLMHGSVVAVGWETTPPTTPGRRVHELSLFEASYQYPAALRQSPLNVLTMFLEVFGGVSQDP